ncbi:MAG: indolepyruvate oxidoreductase subunit beta [Candidatus Izimaplasma sp.]|nr:indolepyruvate oxidoreductase subunit beta [Candidatus Izimaplasma bacterium]
MTTSIKIVGVGGQGTILATTLLSTAIVEAGMDVKMSEIHGMSQRGGSVSSEIRYGEKVFSPVIMKGNANILMAFELMEAARNIDYLKKDGVLIVNNHKINSMVTLNGKVPYPEGIIEDLKSKVETYVIDATAEAIKLGNSKVMNVIMLGALVKAMSLDEFDFEKVIKENVKEKYIDINIKAFNVGLNLI